MAFGKKNTNKGSGATPSKPKVDASNVSTAPVDDIGEMLGDIEDALAVPEEEDSSVDVVKSDIEDDRTAKPLKSMGDDILSDLEEEGEDGVDRRE